MDLSRAASSFSPEQLQFIGTVFVVLIAPNIVTIVVLIWKGGRWSKDIDNLGAIIGTKKGLAIAEKKEKEQTKKLIQKILNKGE